MGTLGRCSTTTLVAIAAITGACDFSRNDRTTAAGIVATIAEEVELRTVSQDDFILSQLLDMDELATATGAETIEARTLEHDADESSFLIVAERDGGFDASDVDAFVELTEQLGASSSLQPDATVDDTFVSSCCITRLIDGGVVLGGDDDGRLREVVLGID